MHLTKSNVESYAWLNYHNPQIYSGDEFFEDMRAFFYVKKLLSRYKRGESYNHHLALNHIITLGNLFGVEPSVNLLYFHTPKDCHPYLNTFFRFLSVLPILPESNEEVKFDDGIQKFLEQL